MSEENKANLEQENSSPILNIVIVIGAIALLGVGIFLYVKYDGGAARVAATTPPKDEESDVALGATLGQVAEGQTAPDFTLSDTSGNNYQLADFKGKPTFITFEATWCTYCHQQNNDVEKIKKEFGAKVNVVTIDLREDAGTVLNAWQQRKNERLVLLDTSGQIGGNYGVTGTPTNIFLNTDSTVSSRHPGLMGYDQMKEALTKLI